MNVAGIGVVFARGRGVAHLEAALREGWVPPAQGVAGANGEQRIPVYAVDQATLADRTVLKGMRRADRFSKMAVLAAWDAVADSGTGLPGGEARIGVILATAFGPQATAFRFLDEIIDHGDGRVSPTLFSHSVHTAAASYVASALKSRGPTLTVTQFAFSFHQALVLASAWIQERRCESVLVGSVDESGAVLEYICSKKLRIPEDGKIRSFEFSASPAVVPGEGSVFLLLRGDATPGRYCEIKGVSFDTEACDGDPDICVLDADGMSADESDYREVASRNVTVAGYSPLFGSMMTGSAFHCAVSAVILKRQTRYACPVQENPHGIELCRITERKKTERIDCIKYNCFHKKAAITLRT